MSRWTEHWQVQSESNTSRYYTVSRAEDGTFGCDCPAWKFKRIQCKHIRGVASALIGSDTDGEIHARMRFIAKINGITLNCDNCAHAKAWGGCYRFKEAKDLLFAEGDKNTFYILGRCCKDYEKKKEE